MPATLTYRVWTTAEAEHLVKRMSEGALYTTIAAEIGRTSDSVRTKAGALGLTIRSAREAMRPAAFPTLAVASGAKVAAQPLPHVVTGQPWEESEDAFLDRVLAVTDRQVSRAHGERFVRLRIESDLPVALSLSSDWHVSTTGATDVRGLLSYAEAVAASDGCYAIAVGDQLDNPVKHKPVNPAQIPEDVRLLDAVVRRFHGKLLAMTSGNHDDWTKQIAGLDALAAIAREHRVHYVPDELIALVEIVAPGTDRVTQRYTVALRHKYLYHSALNPLHAVDRWLERAVNEWPVDDEGRTLLPDVLAIGDNHVAHVGVKSTPRGDVVGVRMGAWQVSSSFARAKGFTRYASTAPVIILHPTRRMVQAHADYAQGLDALARLRSRVAERRAARRGR